MNLVKNPEITTMVPNEFKRTQAGYGPYRAGGNPENGKIQLSKYPGTLLGIHPTFRLF